MRGHGTHHQEPGTWSDDGSLLVCTVNSLVSHEFDTEDMGRQFLDWYENAFWAARGEVFDVGFTTADALSRIRDGVPAEQAGGRDENNNGNGSLMRILPVALRFASKTISMLNDRVSRASVITHGHIRSQMACVFYALVVRDLMAGASPKEAIEKSRLDFSRAFEGNAELKQFVQITADLQTKAEDWVVSSGYVVHTLTASLWCLLTTDNYRDCVLKAVNLGSDTDTTGCVAGGLAGVAYGLDAVPRNWILQLARQPELESLFDLFSELV
jgi:ADP-ribosylglycohydrolase